MNFIASIPMHEVAANTPEDVANALRAIATHVEREGLHDFTLDLRTVPTLDYISYGLSNKYEITPTVDYPKGATT